MKLRLTWVFAVVAIVFSFSLGLLLGCFFSIQEPTFANFFRNPQVVGWAGVVATILVIFIALFLNILREDYQRPRFIITCGSSAPYQVKTEIRDSDGSQQLLHIRLGVQNVGRSVTEACEVRLERILEIRSESGRLKSVARTDHDPRALKWIGRDTTPIPLSPGAFDFVDLGAQNSGFMENFRVDFQDRGHIDLNIADPSIMGFELKGTVYGKNAVPKQFTFQLSWEMNAGLQPVNILEI